MIQQGWAADSMPDESCALRAQPRYERVVPLIATDGKLFSNLYYEANNVLMRGMRSKATGRYHRSGAEIASAWRDLATQARALFVLRDSLFSQQDHPIGNDPYALLLPPSWILAIVHAAAAAEPFQVPMLPPIGSSAWRRFASERELFGDLPASTYLYRAAVGRESTARNAQWTLHQLFREVGDLIAMMPNGPRAVASLGAEKIAAGDRAYFGAELRRTRIIPILVENPAPHEYGEAKGIDIPGRDIPDALREMTIHAIYSRRLEDGDIAVERYDLSHPRERRRAIDLLESLIPRSSASHHTTRVWLWVNGTLEPAKQLKGEDARLHIAGFRRELATTNVDLSRLELFNKPAIELPQGDFRTLLDRELATFDALDTFISISLPADRAPFMKAICHGE